MTTLREAAEMALEALIWPLLSSTWEAKNTAAVNDLQTALEQPDHAEQSLGMAATCKDFLQVEQEPVAWRTFDGEGGYDYRSYEMNETYDKEWAERNPNHKGWVEPLYTAPPKREWVGLTEIEICDIEADELTSANSETFSFARAIEAKLKEKNQ